jgi:hypothetical protein
MRTDIDRILARELGRLGGPLARLVALWMPQNVGEERFEIGLPLEPMRARVRALLARRGQLTELSATEAAGGLSAIARSGIGGLNPAIVTVWTSSRGADRTAVRVRGVAKEGLVKQRGGEQIAREIAAELQSSSDEAD